MPQGVVVHVADQVTPASPLSFATTALSGAVAFEGRVVGGGLEKATETGNLLPLSEPSHALSKSADAADIT